MINFRFIANLMGRLLLIETFFFVLCLCVALFYHEPDWKAYAYTASITLVTSIAITSFVKPKDRILAKKDGYFTVTVVWIVFSLFGCLPYIFSGSRPYRASPPRAHPSSPMSRLFPMRPSSGEASPIGWAAWASLCSSLPFCPA